MTRATTRKTRLNACLLAACLLATCAILTTSASAQDTLLDPLVVVEGLSPSTEAIDRGEKLDNYRLVPSLTDYLIVFQDRMRVEHYSRVSADEWRLVTRDGAGDSILLPTLGCELRLAEVYGRWLAEQP